MSEQDYFNSTEGMIVLIAFVVFAVGIWFLPSFLIMIEKGLLK